MTVRIHTSHKAPVPSLVKIASDKLVKRPDPYAEVFATLPPHLKDILRRTLLKRGQMSDECFQALVHPKVRNLDFSECRSVTARQLSVFPRNLVSLDLNSVVCDFDAADLVRALNGQRGLRTLFLRRSCADNEVAAAIGSHCPSISELDLGICESVGDRGVAALGQGLAHLQSANFSQTSITDQGLLSFAQGECRRTLREIRIDGCREVTDEGIEALLGFCAKLSILIFHNCPKVTEQSRLALENYLLENQISMKQLTWTIY